MSAMLQIIDAGNLPVEIQRQLSDPQRSGLAFATQVCRVNGAKIQTFQVGAASRGIAVGGGPMHSLGAAWAVFGALGVINQGTLNRFRTDIQLKLEDPTTNVKTFLSWSLPFAVTLSIDPGESLRFFLARGGLPTPRASGDFRLDEWTPFAVKNEDTGQIIPVGPLPSLLPPQISGKTAGITLVILGGLPAFGSLVTLLSGEWETFTGWFIAALLFALLGLLCLLGSRGSQREWEKDLGTAHSQATAFMSPSETVELSSPAFTQDAATPGQPAASQPVCANCGTLLSQRSKFCPDCGHALAAKRP